MSISSASTGTATPVATPDRQDAASPHAGPRRWMALGVLALAQFLIVLDASIVNIALPTIGAQLGLDTLALGWVITAYVLPFGGLLLLGGRLADRFGHRRVFLAGTLGFVLASAIAGIAPSSELLIAARAAQGAFAAVLAPSALALVTRLFVTPRERSAALGIWGAVAGLGSAAGVLLGGVLTQSFGWPAVFFVNLPIGLAVLVAIPFLVSRDQRTDRAARLDLAGALTVTGALVALVAGLTAIEAVGILSPVPLLLLAAAVALGVAFVLVERRVSAPLVPLAVFRSRAVLTGNLSMLLIGGAVTGLFFALSLWMQEVLHYDALTAGLTQLPLAGALIAAAGLVPGVIARLGLRGTLAASVAVFAGGLVWLAAAPADAQFLAHVLAPTVLIGAGMGGAFISATQLAVSDVDGGDAGLGGGLVNTAQQIGGVLGITVLVAVSSAASGGGDSAIELDAGYSAAYLVAAALAAAAGVIALVLRPRR